MLSEISHVYKVKLGTISVQCISVTGTGELLAFTSD